MAEDTIKDEEYAPITQALRERGVEYETEDRPTIRYTEWGDWVFSEPLDAKPHTLGAQCELMCIPAAPEQAIAATLGADAKPTKAESSGTLTAENVRELMEENSRQYQSPTDPYVWLTEYDWKAIADELNATLGPGTCHPIISDNLAESEGTGDAWADCSECGHLLFVLTDPTSEPPNFCPNCGAKVVTE